MALGVDVPVGPTADLPDPGEYAAAAARQETSLTKGAVAGAIGGLAGAWAMTWIADAWLAAIDRRGANEDREATELLVQRIADRTMERRLSSDQLSVAAPAAHYALGAAMGAAYGTFAEAAGSNAGLGFLWGTLVWIGTGTIGAWLLGLADLREMPGISAQGFAVHAAYGVVNELVRGAVRPLI